MYWNKDLETLDRGSLESLQLQRLNATLERASRAPFYGKLLSQDGFRKVSSLSGLSRLPFTSKADLREAFPYGFLAVPLENVVRLHSSSGTTGNPTVIYHTKEDIEDWQVTDDVGLHHGAYSQRAMYQIARRDGVSLPRKLRALEKYYR